MYFAVFEPQLLSECLQELLIGMATELSICEWGNMQEMQSWSGASGRAMR